MKTLMSAIARPLLVSMTAGLAMLLAACGGPAEPDASGSPQSRLQSEELAFVDDDGPASADGEATSSAEPQPTTPTTAGSGLPAVTTIPVPAPSAVDGSYTGILGALAPDQRIVDPVAPAPESEAGHLPLTGLPGQVPDRPAAVVKIDNGPAAIPQSGLNSADIVIEEEVEGGVSRFAAIFHSTSAIVGPVRSGRTTDVGLVSGLGSPLLLYSGANDVTETILRRQLHIQNRSHSTSSGFWRDEDRKAPSNLFSDTAPHWESASGGPPPAQFAYRADGVDPGGTASDGFSVNYPASTASWAWDGAQWIRSQRGSTHDVVGGGTVTAVNVVVVEAERVGTGMYDSAGGPVPEFVFVGQGPVTVFTAGRRIEGVWTRPSLIDVATLTTVDGLVIELTPGRTWIQLIEQDSGYLQ